jgi:hypothetical protein
MDVKNSAASGKKQELIEIKGVKTLKVTSFKEISGIIPLEFKRLWVL